MTNPRRWFLLLGIYFVLMVAGRLLVSGSAELDETEQLLLTQSLKWGYGSQPPLYTWLQWLVMNVTGVNLLALALLKWALLFGCFCLMFLAAKEITGKSLPALLAMMAMFFLPQVAWESQRDLTHTVLASTMSAATLYLILRLINGGGLFATMLFGVSVAGGLLSKYNFAVFLAALVLAALTLPQGRGALLRWRLLLSLGVALLLLFPHVAWMVSHPDLLATDAHKLRAAADKGLLISWIAGLLSLVKALIGFSGPCLAVVFLVFRRSTAQEQPSGVASVGRVLIERTLLIILLLCVVLIFCFQARFKERWLQPLLLVTPLYLILRVESRCSLVTAKHLLGLAAAVALGVLMANPAIPLLASVTGRPTRLNAPYGELAFKLEAKYGKPDVIVADSRLTGGNLRLAFPKSSILAPGFASAATPRVRNGLVVWDATQHNEPPAELLAWLARWSGSAPKLPNPTYLEAPLQYAPAKHMQLGCAPFAFNDTGAGTDRRAP